MWVTIKKLHQKRSKPVKNSHFCKPAISSLKWGASILLPPICSHHRLLCFTTNTSEKYERTQQGNLLGVYALGRVGIVEERIYMHYAGLGVGIKSLAAVNHRRWRNRATEGLRRLFGSTPLTHLLHWLSDRLHNNIMEVNKGEGQQQNEQH